MYVPLDAFVALAASIHHQDKEVDMGVVSIQEGCVGLHRPLLLIHCTGTVDCKILLIQ